MESMNTWIAEDCLNAQGEPCCDLASASFAGLLSEEDAWTCDECGTEWRAEVIQEAVKHWKPRPTVMVCR